MLHHFPGEDGLPLSGWLFRPTGAFGSTPTLIWLHGGPEAQERPIFQPLLQALLAEGVAVFAPNVRGSGGYGRTFTQADDLRPAVRRDHRRARRGRRRWCAAGSPTRAGSRFGGRSYGGYLTLVALARFPELFRAGIDVCGIADFDHVLRSRPSRGSRRPPSRSTATRRRDATLLRALSPIHSADRITAPLLVVHGAYDTNVPIVEAEQIVAALRDARRVAAGSCCSTTRATRSTHRHTRGAVRARVVRWVTGTCWTWASRRLLRASAPW